jgi:hypothetical protein
VKEIVSKISVIEWKKILHKKMPLLLQSVCVYGIFECRTRIIDGNAMLMMLPREQMPLCDTMFGRYFRYNDKLSVRGTVVNEIWK